MVVSVKKLTIITLRDYEEDLLWDLGKLGVVQLKKLKEKEFLGFKEAIAEDVHKYVELLDRYKALYNALCIDCKIPKTPEKLKEGKVSPLELEREIDMLESKLAYINTESSRCEQRIASLEKILNDKLLILKKYNIHPKIIGEFSHIISKIGFMSNESVKELKLSLEKYKTAAIIKEYPLSEQQSLVHVTGLIELKEDLLKVLSSYDFKEIIIPPEVPEDINDAIAWVNSEIKRSKAKLKELNTKFEELKQSFIEKAFFLQKSLFNSYKLASAQTNLLRSNLMVILQGWIPEDKIPKLNSYFVNLKKEYGEQFVVSYETPDPHEEIPSIYKVPKLFTTYQTLIRQYGIPAPNEPDPTIVGGILWTIMFGMMFPDYGEGLVITIIGIFLAFFVKRKVLGLNPKRVGRLMIVLGISAMIFGLLVGEFFLTEVEPLWPGLPHGWLEEPFYVLWLLKIALFFGIAEMCIGMLIGIYHNLKHGHKIEALMGEHGLAGLITFLGMVLIAFYFIGIYVLPPIHLQLPLLGTISISAIDFPALGINAFFNWPLILLIVGIIAMLSKSMIEKEGIAIGASMAYETVLSFMTNMFSFVRIAGFAIAHAALAIVVIKLMEYNPILGIGMGLIFLNAFALILEFIVVIIQATRLTFYEFLTKFYDGRGKEFTPYRL